MFDTRAALPHTVPHVMPPATLPTTPRQSTVRIFRSKVFRYGAFILCILVAAFFFGNYSVSLQINPTTGEMREVIQFPHLGYSKSVAVKSPFTASDGIAKEDKWWNLRKNDDDLLRIIGVRVSILRPYGGLNDIITQLGFFHEMNVKESVIREISIATLSIWNEFDDPRDIQSVSSNFLGRVTFDKERVNRKSAAKIKAHMQETKEEFKKRKAAEALCEHSTAANNVSSEKGKKP